MTKQKIKKILITLPVISAVILFNISPVLAISIPSPSSVASQLEKRYHLNLDSIRDQGETFNVADTKKTTPQVMLSFSPSDPKPGEKLTVQALPMYFGNANENLYYTWYLKHKDCDLDNNPGSDKKELCDKDNSGTITVNDWKIEAMQKITNNDYDTKKADYGNDNDNDGYKVNWGGNEREDMPNYCYVHDFNNGVNYELNDSSDITFDCPSGATAKCVKNEDLACSNISVIGESFTEYQICKDLEETPVCNSGTASCGNGTPACVSSLTEYDCDSHPALYSTASCSTIFGSSAISCAASSESSGSGENLCKHLFPSYKNFHSDINTGISGSVHIDLRDKEVGDGKFNEDEEAFWGTNPHDPDTADNGNTDEANAVGLGINEFTWTYFEDDEIGVAVEGVAMITTKHDDSSMMIMWGFPKNDCPVEDKGEYTKSIKGYEVKIPTANMDLNNCLEKNLVDPREGGQPKKLDVFLSYSPENPVNDPTEDNAGDMITAQAMTTNASRENSLRYQWSVEISSNPFDNNSWKDITNELTKNKLILGHTDGISLSSLKFRLNLNTSTFSNYKTYFSKNTGYTGYIKIKVLASENFSKNVTREGKTDVVVKVISTNEKITAHAVDVNSNGKLSISGTSSPICQDRTSGKRAPICFVLKNEIVGVKLENADDELENFSWTLGGKPLICNSSISSLCQDNKQTNYNFFPVTGNTGDNFVLNLTANNIESGKSIQLTRTFQIIDPFVKIGSSDRNSVWPR